MSDDIERGPGTESASGVPEPAAVQHAYTPPQDFAETAPPLAAAGAARYARPFEIITILSVIATDQLSKAIIRRTLALYDHVPVVPGFLDITHVQNTGAAFGLLNAADFPFKAALMIGVAAIALVAIAAYATQLGFHERLARFGLALILGGAFGNLLDRAIAGYVVDFVDVYWGNAHFWAFNIADAAISIGAALVLLDMIGLGRQHASHPV